MLASGEISKDSLVKSWPGNREEVVRRGPRTSIRRSARRVESPFCLGEQYGTLGRVLAPFVRCASCASVIRS